MPNQYQGFNAMFGGADPMTPVPRPRRKKKRLGPMATPSQFSVLTEQAAPSAIPTFTERAAPPAGEDATFAPIGPAGVSRYAGLSGSPRRTGGFRGMPVMGRPADIPATAPTAMGGARQLPGLPGGAAALPGAPQRTGAPVTASDWEPGEAGRFARYREQGLSTDEAMWQERLHRASEESIARMGGRRAGRAAYDEREAVAAAPSAFRGLPTIGQPGGQLPAGIAANVAGAAAAPMQGLPSSRLGGASDVQGGLGRYSRPLTPGFGQGTALQDQAKLAAANQQLAEDMQAAAPPATAGTNIMSSLQPGKSLGRFAEPFTGSLEEYTQAQIAHREALAAGQPSEGPGPFQTEWSPGESGFAAAQASEKVTKERRLARRGIGTSPRAKQQVERRARVALKKQGLPHTAEDGRIERKLAAGEELTPAQEVRKYGEGIIPGQMLAAQTKQKQVQLDAQERQGIRDAAARGLEFTKIPSERKRLLGMMGSGKAGAGGKMTKDEYKMDIEATLTEDAADDPAAWEDHVLENFPDIPEKMLDDLGRDRFPGEWKDRNKTIFDRGTPTPSPGFSPLIPGVRDRLGREVA